MKLLKQKNNKSLTPNRFSYIRINFQLTEFCVKILCEFSFYRYRCAIDAIDTDIDVGDIV